MVRLNEILNEEIDIKKIKTFLETHVVFYEKEDEHIDPNTGKVSISAEYTKITKSVDGRLPVNFSSIIGDFMCNAIKDLKSLEGCPDSVTEDFVCQLNPLLESFEHMPRTIEGGFYGSDNPGLNSLKGLEMTSEINFIHISYNPVLPMLRLLVANNFYGFRSQNDRQTEYDDLSDIISHHMHTYPNKKERVIKCQYAMIKAGYKENAKW